MSDRRKHPQPGPALNYPDDRNAARWKSHVRARPSPDADYDGSSTLVRRSWFGRYLKRKSPRK
jgi:hypothetical protein